MLLRVCDNERERERGERRGEGVVIAFKVPLGISKVSDKFLPSFFSRAEKFSYSTLRRPLFPSCANFEQLYIYVCVCVYDRASILFLPRVKLAQFSLTSNAWLSFEQLFKSVCLTLRLPCFFFFFLRYLTRFFYFSPSKVGTRLF